MYLAFGMTYELFWHGESHLVKAYREADAIRKRRRNEELWWEGLYTTEALKATVCNMFAKGQPFQYPEEPFPITEEEQRERQEREQKAKMERIKAMFTARALAVNAKIGVKTNDE